MVVSQEQLMSLTAAFKKAVRAHNGRVNADTTESLSVFKKVQTKFRVEAAKYQANLKYSLYNTGNAGAIEMVKFGENAPEERRVFYLLDTEGPKEGLFVMPAELGDLENTFKEWKQGEKGAR